MLLTVELLFSMCQLVCMSVMVRFALLDMGAQVWALDMRFALVDMVSSPYCVEGFMELMLLDS